ncbi:MAG: hypothetical protein AB7F65_09205 [Dehalococcoidia bacterium]
MHHTRGPRTLLLLLALIGVASALVACGTESGNTTSTPTPGPEDRFQTPRTLQSYRYVMHLRADGALLDQSEAPAGLDLSDEEIVVDIEGRWVSPGNEYQHAVFSFGPLEVKQDSTSIDGRFWTSVEGGAWREREALTGPEDILGQDIPLSPDAVLGRADESLLDRVTADLEQRPHTFETLNGREARRWTLGNEWFDAYAADFAEFLSAITRDQGLDLTIDIWNDTETGVGVKLRVEAIHPEGHGSMSLDIEMFDLNDPDITVEVPAGAISR